MALKPNFVVPLDLGTITTGNETAGYPATNMNRMKAIGLTWKTSGASNVWIRGNFGSAKPVDFCSVIAANALPGTTIRLRLGATQAAVDGTAAYDSGAVAFINPSITREDGLYHSHLELPSVQTYQWWRIDIGGHTGDFQAAMAVMGQKITPGRFYNYDFEFGNKDLGSMDWGRFGVINEEPGKVLDTVDFTLAWLSEAEYEASFRPMLRTLGRRGIVHCCFDPTANTYRQDRTFMGPLAKSPFAKGVRKPGTFTADFSIESFINGSGGSTAASGTSTLSPSLLTNSSAFYAATVSTSGGGTAGEPIGLLLSLTKAS